MKIILLLIILSSIFPPLAMAEPETELAVASAKKWLLLVDAAEYEKSWNESAAHFKSSVPKENWASLAASVREPAGAVLSRKLISATYAKSLPHAPAGEYVVIQFKTEFKQKAAAVETVTPMLEENGEWKVSGYYIK